MINWIGIGIAVYMVVGTIILLISKLIDKIKTKRMILEVHKMEHKDDYIYEDLSTGDPLLDALNKKIKENNAKDVADEEAMKETINKFKSWCDDRKYMIRYTFDLLKKWQMAADDNCCAVYTLIRVYNFEPCGSKFHALGRHVVKDEEHQLHSDLYGVSDSGKAVIIEPAYPEEYNIDFSFSDPYKYGVLSEDAFMDGIAKGKWDPKSLQKEVQSFIDDFIKFNEALKHYLKTKFGIEEDNE